MADPVKEGEGRARIEIKKAAVDAATPEEKSYYVWDVSLEGFGLRVTPKGCKTYYAKVFPNGKQSWVKLGRHGEITAEEARRKAVSEKGKAINGVDPAKEKKERRGEKTVSELIVIFKARHIPTLTTGGSKPYLRALKVLDRILGPRLVSSITRFDINDAFHSLVGKKTPGNELVMTAKVLFEKAIDWGYRKDGSNPARGANTNPLGKRQRVLTREEVVKLGQVLREFKEMSLNLRKAGGDLHVLL